MIDEQYCTATEIAMATTRREPTSLESLDLGTTGRVLIQSPTLLIIDKPCDVRMDGDAPVTVEKLMLQYLATPATATATATATREEEEEEEKEEEKKKKEKEKEK